MRSDGLNQPRRIVSPAVVLGAIWAVALGMALVPRGVTQPIRNGWREMLRPSLAAAGRMADWTASRWTEIRSGADARLAAAGEKNSALAEQVRQLQMQLAIALSDRPGGAANHEADAGQLPPLLISKTIAARVLGRQAQLCLSPRDLLDVGRSRGAKAQSLVVEDAPNALADASGEVASKAPLLDEGLDAAVQRDRLVLSGSRVWGKVAEVGPHTSTVQRVTDAGYRDLVQLATRREGHLHFAARGMLAGSGQPLCKIELVDATQAVTVGDLVFTSSDGMLDTPLLYGRVARVEKKPGAAHWEIWMEPAISAGSEPGSVAVLRMELNPARVAESRD